ncbi:hypothetical protein SNE40_011265 [Patella caerulea]|uniref:Uncharacterized protein n=1 Tax=Patella caerulea TaxID=87958 RepID=A0AAN8PHU7_PATCE
MSRSAKYLRIKEEGNSDDDEKLPVWRKICFAVGGAPYQITTNVLGFFLNIFLLEVAELKPLSISMILLIGKVWDAVTDPACGYFVTKTETRFGKMKPWIILSAPFACTAYFFLWYVPDFSDDGKTVYYLLMYCAFQGLLSGLHVPYTSMTMFITNDQKERDSATAYRMVSEAIGVLLAIVVQGRLIEATRKAGDCEDAKTTVSPESLFEQELSYRYGALIFIGIYMVCAVTVFLGVKEKPGVVEDHGTEGYFSSLKIVLTYKPYVKAGLIFLFMSLAVAVVQGNLALYCTHTLKMGDQFSNFVLVLMIVAIAAIPVWQLVLQKIGKKKTYAAGLIIFIPILITQLFLPKEEPIPYYFVVAFAGLSVSVSLLLPWSLLPDVLDLFMLEKNTRKDAMFYSFYVFFNKLAVGLGLALSLLALDLGGYETGACTQPKSVDLTLRLLVVPGPVIFVLIALLSLWSYPIDEDKRKAIKQEVLSRLSARGGNGEDFGGSMSYESIKVSSSTEI